MLRRGCLHAARSGGVPRLAPWPVRTLPHKAPNVDEIATLLHQSAPCVISWHALLPPAKASFMPAHLLPPREEMEWDTLSNAELAAEILAFSRGQRRGVPRRRPAPFDRRRQRYTSVAAIMGKMETHYESPWFRVHLAHVLLEDAARRRELLGDQHLHHEHARHADALGEETAAAERQTAAAPLLDSTARRAIDLEELDRYVRLVLASDGGGEGRGEGGWEEGAQEVQGEGSEGGSKGGSTEGSDGEAKQRTPVHQVASWLSLPPFSGNVRAAISWAEPIFKIFLKGSKTRWVSDNE